ncbi:MAG: uncharacterized protein JWM76_3108 [Pseudonocardiales bacterium]|nr:uncharacterized protein [Pseudonocardiales bacterium]
MEAADRSPHGGNEGNPMIELNLLAAWVATRYLAIDRRIRRSDVDRGDVPGWVMVTVMTAGLVVGIFAVFKTKITTAVTGAIDSVTSGTN